MDTRLITLIAAAALTSACMPEKAYHVWPGGGSGGGGSIPSAVQISPAAPGAGTLVTFDSSPLGAGSRTWSFGDGGSDTGMVVTHTFVLEGVYDIQLIVDNGSDAPEELVLRLVVSDAGGDPEISGQLRRPRR